MFSQELDTMYVENKARQGVATAGRHVHYSDQLEDHGKRVSDTYGQLPPGEIWVYMRRGLAHEGMHGFGLGHPDGPGHGEVDPRNETGR